MKNYTIKIYKNDGARETFRTKKKKRFLKNLRTINWQKNVKKVYLKVTYGEQIDVCGKLVMFYNDGHYDNKKDFWQAFNVFDEDD